MKRVWKRFAGDSDLAFITFPMWRGRQARPVPRWQHQSRRAGDL